MPGTVQTSWSTLSSPELLRRVVEVYAEALQAMRDQETEKLGEILAYRRELLEQVKLRSANDWAGDDPEQFRGLIEEVRRSEARFITALDERVKDMRQRVVNETHQRRGLAAYQRTNRGVR